MDRVDSLSDMYHMRHLQDQVQLSDACIGHTDNKTCLSIHTKPGLTQVRQGRGHPVVFVACIPYSVIQRGKNLHEDAHSFCDSEQQPGITLY